MTGLPDHRTQFKNYAQIVRMLKSVRQNHTHLAVIAVRVHALVQCQPLLLALNLAEQPFNRYTGINHCARALFAPCVQYQ